jgi:hypothetical protein
MNGLTLEVVENAFRQWREQRNSRADKIPKNLWRMASSLYPQYNRATICRRLGLSGGQFKQHINDRTHTSSDSGFVLAFQSLVQEPSISNFDIQLTIQGKERTLICSLNVHALGTLLPHIERLL